MDRYAARINLNGYTQRERHIERLQQDILNKVPNNPSYKQVILNDADTHLIINKGTAPHYKTFTSLPGQKILQGDYVTWKNNVWLVYNADCDDEIYTYGDLRQCNYKLYWQDSTGNIKSRYVWVQNASAYNNGEQGNNIITLQSNQFMVYMIYDEDTCLLDNGNRINMVRNNQKCRPYVLTRPDDISYSYGEQGVLNIIFTQDQYRSESDKLVDLEDGSQVWICDYHSPVPSPEPPAPDETTDLSAVITGGNTLRCGRAKTWTVAFTDRNGNEINDCDFRWSIISDHAITQNINDQKIQLKVDDEQLIDCSFILSVSVGDAVVAETTITIVDGL